MEKVQQEHLRSYFLFNYDNDYRAMVDNHVIGIKAMEKDLSTIFNAVDPVFELNNILDSYTEIDQVTKLALKKLIFDIEIGDAVCLADKENVLAIGIVESNYQYKRNKELPHARKIRWLSQDKIKLEDGNPRLKIREVEKEESYKVLEDIINNVLIEDEDNGLLINYLSRITVENYINFFKKARLNPHEIELLNLIYQNQHRGISLFDLQKHFDGIDIDSSIEKLGRKISRRFHLSRVEGKYSPNIFNGVLRDGHICLVLKNELAQALEELNIVCRDDRSADTVYGVRNAVINSIYPSLFFEEALELLLTKRNLHLIGPWGTGKSYFARRLAYLVLGNRNVDNILKLKMHPSQDYHELLYSGNSRILYRFIEKARKNTLENYVIILEDCHQVDLSRVLGEIEFLIEDNNREKEAALDVSFDDKKYYLPRNIYVIKTSRETHEEIKANEISNVLFFEMEALFNNRFIRMFQDAEFGRWVASTFSELNEQLEKYNFSFNHGLFLKSDRGINIEEYNVVLRYKIKPILKRLVNDSEYKKMMKKISYK